VDKNDFIEVYRDDDWRSVCDDYWTCEDADVACRQLGFLPFGNHILTPLLLRAFVAINSTFNS
jgi:hypothetical protein